MLYSTTLTLSLDAIHDRYIVLLPLTTAVKFAGYVGAYSSASVAASIISLFSDIFPSTSQAIT